MFNQGGHPLIILDEWEILEHMRQTDSQLAQLYSLLERSQQVIPNRRYHLAEAAGILRFSERTLKRRAEEGALIIIKDGKKPFVTGAELLRYMRQAGERWSP